jgi:ABC-2 type transport system permease protein
MSELSASAKRVLAHAYHILISVRRDGFRLLDVTVWPLILFFSMTLFAGVFTVEKRILGLIILGALGWRVIYHFQLESVQLYMDNYWSGMIEHVMISPLNWWEFVLGGTISAVAKILIIGSLFLGLGWLAFGFAVTDWGVTLLAFLAIAACGIVFAIFSLGVAFLKRGDAFAFIFAFPDAIAVLSGVFYPTSVFPEPLRSLAQLLPTTHAFNLLKSTLGMAEPNLLFYAGTLVVWFVLALLFMNWAMKKARRDGKLVKMK